ncbi:ribbon-helix-helix protein, CopG family [Kribbella sindirgiensis]|uniref:Ribbon-helix-helix protein, CopG family n=1 Tax=Kribbella sindirgiensis TaxID=1124744 RepID=A0A4R0JCE0_9ACTN|nr:ribbon-helix-helix protein, CopG family [Kribbella sindirgiensis]TCC43124.1 ribbon-helix-helix protein, CopG family [Kribbella sindirgiensis]
MAMNLRLPSEVATALQAEAARTGRSQQEIVRDALGRHLHLIDHEAVEALITDRARRRRRTARAGRLSQGRAAAPAAEGNHQSRAARSRRPLLMRVYFDSSALIKRVVAEEESDDLIDGAMSGIDERLADVCRRNALAVASPGRS